MRFYRSVRFLGCMLFGAHLFAGQAAAGEGGGSMYLQATYGDFQAAIFGPPGLYYRNYLFFYDASIGARPLDGRVNFGVDQKVWASLSKFAYLTNEKVFGGRVGFAIAVPVVLNGTVGGSVSAGNLQGFRSGDVSGVGDIYVNPLLLNWTEGNNHFTFGPGITVPTGQYDADRLLNVGRNYWSFDLTGAYTYFDPKSGLDISATAGFMFNAENPDTDYRTGTEFHLDWLVGKFLTPNFALAVAGYFYDQIEGDSGHIVGNIDVSNFRGEGAGIGPAIKVNIPKTSYSFTGKALFDVADKKRLDGNLYMLSGAFKF